MKRITFPRITFPLVASVLLIGCVQTSPQPIKAVAAVEEPFPIPVIEMRGDAAQLGTAHAEHLAQPIRHLFGDYFGKYFQNDVQRNIALMAATAFKPQMLPAHRDEIASLASGVGLDERQVLLGQCFLDLTA